MALPAFGIAPQSFEIFHKFYLADEAELIARLRDSLNLSQADRSNIFNASTELISACREIAQDGELFDAFLQEYGLSTEEGVTLMRLAEALIRTPDNPTAHLLLRDKLSGRDWAAHHGQSTSSLVNLSTGGMALSAAWVKMTGGAQAENLAARLGDTVLHQGVKAAMGVMSGHFVLGRDIEHAISKSADFEKVGFSFSYDMLGEAAHTLEDAERYRQNYQYAIDTLAKKSNQYASSAAAPGISVKLSALHPRYEYNQRDLCVPALLDSLKPMALAAKAANMGLTIDAEEADRLEVSMLVAKALLEDKDLANWDGLAIVVQAYQRRAMVTIQHLLASARAANRKFCIRLVKGAYWDMEIKRAQEMGLESYPVFTRKENTDLSYLACARVLLDNREIVFPQFATHNASSMSAILHMASGGENKDYTGFEFQRLHGMGEVLHREIMKRTHVPSRIYAPVGAYKDLLPYLVRRLLENGANSSFVNQLLDERVKIDDIARDPVEHTLSNAVAANPAITAPRDMFSGQRLAAKGLDYTQAVTAVHLESLTHTPLNISAHSIINGKKPDESHKDNNDIIYNPAQPDELIGTASHATKPDLAIALQAAKTSSWANIPAAQRAACLMRAADRLEAQMDYFMVLCVKEAGKTWLDAISEVREAVDFLRYYSLQAQTDKFETRKALGTIACISPWNFPLAIFLGQVSASLAAGNCVICKPAEHTPLIAYEAVKILHDCGVPKDALHLTIGSGAVIGAALSASPEIDGICFTGSIATAKRIAKTLADTDRATIPFIAETGGLNAMIVDSTALLEQAVSDVVASGFQSAGQRCSACRLVCLQDEIADDFIKMLSGSMEVLSLGNPEKLAIDIGPVINADARSMLENYISEQSLKWEKIGHTKNTPKPKTGYFIRPTAFEIPSPAHMLDEKFGPILHITRYKSGMLDKLIDDINGLGYGLTMGLHTRIDSRIEHVSQHAHIGNLYVNRNQIGAVVGVQPFGGEGLSGTGPKAGGPLYMMRLSKPDTQKAPFRNGNKHGDTITLPGPTGETNTLHFHPRGTLLLFAHEDIDITQRQISMATISGNQLIIATDDPEPIKARLKAMSKDPHMKPVTFISLQEGMTYIDKDIDGVIADGSHRQDIAARMARRKGVILPILSVNDDIERFVIERTITINTTAAGGNASLLAQ